MSLRVSRRRALQQIGAAAAGALAAPRLALPDLSAQTRRPVPSRAQLEWQRDELALFLHVGINTFTDREWGDGKEDPADFAPSQLDARQWARAAKAGGFRAMILTAKHHDGFCLWPTKTTTHSVASSPWRGGAGDLVRELVNACRAEGLKAGLYLSPWDRHEPSYGDSPRYNDLYCDQLTELLTRYGTISEVWFDGANGEGPNGKKQTYDWPRVWALVKRLQPNAVIFSDAGPDVRWIGNENGVAGETNWSTVDPRVVPVPGTTGRAAMQMLREGDPNGTVWRPGETDVSIRPGWFHHPAEDARVKSAGQLKELYFTSVGRNSKLLLNVPPTRQGLLHETDIKNLAAMKALVGDTLGHDLLRGRSLTWRSSGARSAIGEIDLGRTREVQLVDLAEDIPRGQIVSRYRVEGTEDGGSWKVLSQGTTIGYRKIDRFAPTTIRTLRVIIEESLETPRPLQVGLQPVLRLEAVLDQVR
jgi:alpha-L-fucosidase